LILFRYGIAHVGIRRRRLAALFILDEEIMTDNILKFIGAALLYAVWGALVYFGKTPADGYITAITAGLAGLGIWHAATNAGISVPLDPTPTAVTVQTAPALEPATTPAPAPK
jgi:glutamate-1-semialdehyde aminotransferase